MSKDKEWFSQDFIDGYLKDSKEGAGLDEGASPISLEELEGHSSETAEDHGLELLYNIPLDVRVRFGTAYKHINEILKMKDGSVVKLDKFAGEHVDVLVGERVVARGEIMILEENFGVRITEIVPPQDMLKYLKESIK